MNKQALQIILDGVASKKLDVESAIILIEAIQQHTTPTTIPNISTPTINPSDLTYPNPDWTYDPNRTGTPWYTVSKITNNTSDEP